MQRRQNELQTSQVEVNTASHEISSNLYKDGVYTHIHSERTDEIDLVDLIQPIWQNRIKIALAASVYLLLFGAFAYLSYLWTPSQLVQEQQFRLTFAGAAEGVFENKTPFSMDEAIGPVFLKKVHQELDLEKTISLTHLRESLRIVPSDLELLIAEKKYRAMLANDKLSATELAAIEKEFETTKTKNQPVKYSIQFQESAHIQTLPTSVTERIFSGVLTAWAAHAQDTIGVNRREVTNFSAARTLKPNKEQILKYVLDVEDIAEAQILFARQIIKEIPGATTYRSEDGKSLRDLEFQLTNSVARSLEIAELQTFMYLSSLSLRNLSEAEKVELAQDQALLSTFIAIYDNDVKREQDNVAVYSDALERFDRSVSEGDPNKYSEREYREPSSRFSDSAAAGAPIRDLLSLGAEKEKLDYRKELVNQLIASRLALNEATKKRARLSMALDSRTLNSTASANSAQTSQNRVMSRESILQSVDTELANLVAIEKQLNDALNSFEFSRNDGANSLFRFTTAVQTISEKIFPKKSYLLAGIAGGFLVLLASCLYFIIKKAHDRRVALSMMQST